jgi:hypothetical protein
VYFLVVRRYAPFSSFDGGFEGDSRTEATVNPMATARTIGVVAFARARRYVSQRRGVRIGCAGERGDAVRLSDGRRAEYRTAAVDWARQCDTRDNIAERRG